MPGTRFVRLPYQQRERTKAQNGGLTSAIGREVCHGDTCAVVTQSSILKACQFGCGKGGKLVNLVRNGMDCSAPGTADGAGTSVCKYLVSGAGYDARCITNSSDGINCIAPAPKSSCPSERPLPAFLVRIFTARGVTVLKRYVAVASFCLAVMYGPAANAQDTTQSR